ncbi:Rv2175c family DNA-binding protein [Nocardiopsis halophila]|uniref:Rv2175c family DNA-binding protein n=1 Tax=Nocardiopsis halophila TaxID=141692 RepID=UPI00034B9651|nr:Rv2175c family DNA-binding protein [Nocardiopsis halophila]
MTQNDNGADSLVGDWMTLNEAGTALGIGPNRVKQYMRERRLLGVRRKGEVMVPAALIAGGDVLKGLPGTLTLLADSGFSEEEALEWLFTPDDTLPGSPVQALAENRGTEVRRRAQALGSF